MTTMRNATVLATQKDTNPFTLALKARCLAEGEVLVRMRNDGYCKVVYRPSNEEAGEDEAFHKPDHSAYWAVNGESFTSSRFDIVEMDAPDGEPADLMSLRVQMVSEGWSSEDNLTHAGWVGGAGYSIWFKRYDWHGKRAMALTGTAATYHAHTPDPTRAFEVAKKAAQLARRAWAEFPDCPPSQDIHFVLVARKSLG